MSTATSYVEELREHVFHVRNSNQLISTDRICWTKIEESFMKYRIREFLVKSLASRHMLTVSFITATTTTTTTIIITSNLDWIAVCSSSVPYRLCGTIHAHNPITILPVPRVSHAVKSRPVSLESVLDESRLSAGAKCSRVEVA